MKEGRRTVGVAGQYTGAAGRIENTQVGVYLVDVTGAGQAFFGRELSLAVSWTDDPSRCTAAGVADDVVFATKPALAGAMLARALRAGVRARWFAGDKA